MYFKKVYKGKYELLLLSTLMMAITALDGIASPYFLGAITNQVNAHNFTQLPATLLYWGLSLSLILAAGQMNVWFYGRLIQKFNIEMKSRVLERAYQRQGVQIASSHFQTTILSDIREVENNYLQAVRGIIYSLLQGILTLGFLLAINWKVGLIFIILGAFPTFVPQFTGRYLKESTKEWQAANHSYVGVLEDTLEARLLVTRSRVQSLIYERALAFLRRVERQYLLMKMKQSLVSNLISVLYIWTIVLSFYLSIRLVQSGNVSAGVLLTAYMSADRVTTPIISISQYYNAIQTSRPILEELYRKEENEGAPELVHTASRLISLEDVTLEAGGRPLLENFNLVIHKGERVLIRGASGSGKSTLLRAILGERLPNQGQIAYGEGIDSIYEAIAVIDQTPFAFEDTLRFNLTLGRNYSDERLLEILKRVELSHLASVERLDERIGKHGRQLSGGEMKRLELARALLMGKEILIVDEVLSGLDEKRAYQIQQVIFDNFKTVIDVEHHISAAQRAAYDKIVEL